MQRHHQAILVDGQLGQQTFGQARIGAEQRLRSPRRRDEHQRPVTGLDRPAIPADAVSAGEDPVEAGIAHHVTTVGDGSAPPAQLVALCRMWQRDRRRHRGVRAQEPAAQQPPRIHARDRVGAGVVLLMAESVRQQHHRSAEPVQVVVLARGHGEGEPAAGGHPPRDHR
ncbi:hypothetical protein BJF85_23680 [Saccharomonospora sp. CUA-673]|uniref:hypothetical protein n=1 Tax=Saccharomonospora sp. CUA-673 TaxID=1904969 RepID=UPI00095E188F|nr:hypothetical protein [Saccharomonospora sp. CUA-673]OLT41569.1 hypothetical protein BJF85_23680 [Saccharomonospora sp. CUA-673]